jgi:hypothetical protein
MYKGLALMKQVDHYRREIETKYPPHPLHRLYLNQREMERGKVEGGHRVGRVLSVSPVVGIGTPPPL